jgi:hypothetical protein
MPMWSHSILKDEAKFLSGMRETCLNQPAVETDQNQANLKTKDNANKMALPPEHKTARIMHINSIVANTPAAQLFEFPVLQPADHQLIGAFIQYFNYIDLNLRRAIEAFAHARLLQGDAAKRYPRIHSSMVAAAVQDAVRVMDPKLEDITEAIRILEIIERRREIRNLLGHWAARRVANEDAIVLLTKNERDAMQTGGTYLGQGGVKTAVLDLADMRGLIQNELIPFELWLARKASDWWKRYVGD